MHHIWYPTDKFEETAAFYQRVVNITGGDVELDFLDGVPRNRARVITDGSVELHFGTPDHNLLFKNGRRINPYLHHHAFRVDDIEAAKARLEEHAIPYDDHGITFIRGRYQLFFHDPAGNIVELTTDAG
jgi:catechol 2,3-dioxygenase-like lactoylglutathione lyase family enzyme